MDSAEIFVRFQRESWHRWPGAPERRSYLRHRHRHIFHVEVRVQGTAMDDSREIEYHDLLDLAKDLWDERLDGPELGASSCETLALALAEELRSELERPVAVEVSEDGECGARVWKL